MSRLQHTQRGVSIPALILIGIVLAIIGTIVVLDRNAQDPERRKVEVKPAPTFTLKNYAGETVSSDDFTGRVRILNSWATWCPFCVDELPDFTRLQEEFGNEIVVIAINREESRERAQSYTDELGISNKLIFLLDPKDMFYRQASGIGMPITLFVSADGNVVIKKQGPMALEEMREKTLQALGRKQ